MTTTQRQTLDLEIRNYTFPQIEAFFRLKPNSKYTQADVEEKEYQIREILLHSGQIDKRLKRDLIEFLEKGKQWIVSTACNTKDIGPTTLPKNPRLDNFDYPKSAPALSRENEIIVRPETNFTYASHGSHIDFYKGIINPLDKRIITRFLNIDSKFRQNYMNTASTDFLFQIPERFNKVVSMHLSSIEIPQTYYNISASYGNNFLWIAARDEFFYDYKIFIIPDGNYTAKSLIKAINLLLAPIDDKCNLICPESLFSYIELDLDLECDGSGTGQVYIHANDRPQKYGGPLLFINLNFCLDINGEPDRVLVSQKIGWVLGFFDGKYEGCLLYKSEGPILLQTMPYIFLAIDDYNNSVNNGFISAFEDSILNADILARISLTQKVGEFGTIIIQNNSSIITQPREYFGPVDITKLRVRLYDSYGRILNLNYRDFSFCLIFKMLYDL